MKNPRYIMLILLSASAVSLVTYTYIKSPGLTHGFASYYTHSKLLSSGGDMTAAYDTIYFHRKMNEFGMGNVKDLANLPTGSFLFLPVSAFEPVTAKVWWSILSIIFLFISIYVLFLSFDIPFKSDHALMLSIVTLLFYPLYYNIALGQVYVFLLLLGSIAVYGFRKDNPWLIAVPLSLLLLLKGYGLFPMLALILTRKFRAFFITAVIVLMVFLATLPLFGISAWQMYYREFLSIIAFGENASNVAYQSLNSFFGHLLVYHPERNPGALFNAQQVNIYYAVQAIGVLALYILSRALKENNAILLFTASFAVNVIVSPSGEDYHSLLYLPLFYLTAKQYFEKPLKFSLHAVLLISAILLLASPIPFRSLQLSEFPVYLLAYPRLYGAILLIMVCANDFKKSNRFLKTAN